MPAGTPRRNPAIGGHPALLTYCNVGVLSCSNIFGWRPDLGFSAAVIAFGLGSSRVIFTLVYLVVRSVLGLLVVLFRRDLSKDAELLVLRHENAVLRRH